MEDSANIFLRLRRRPWVGYLAALGFVALVTWSIGFLASRAEIANASMLYLVAVLLTATAFGSGPAVLAATAAVLSNEWFFVEPRGTIAITRPEQWMEFLLFLMTAIVTGQLAVGQRQRAEQAEQERRDARLLYDLVRLMSDSDLHRALGAVADRLRHELRVPEVTIELLGTTPLKAHASMTSSPREADKPPRVVPVVAQEEAVGYIRLAGEGSRGFHEAEDRLLSAAASQLSLAVERTRLRQEATEGEILRRTDELKTALLNAVSHELRTPLASIIASAGSLLERDVAWSEQERQEFAEAIEHEARRLDRLVSNLLDLSRLQSGSLQPQKEWYDLGALVDDVLGRLRPITAQHSVKVDIPEDLPPVHLDYVKIDHALSNLIENAVKYSPPGSEILLSARVADKQVQVEVADRGPGVPPADLTRVFEPFFRVGAIRVRPQGTGLGLAVAKGMVEAHGGRIWAESRSGGGTSFLFRLPIHGAT